MPELTYSDVSEHTTKKDLYMVIHDKYVGLRRTLRGRDARD